MQFPVSRAVCVSACAERMSSACALSCWHVSRAGRASTFSFVCCVLSACGSRAERASSFSFLCQELIARMHVSRELSVCVHVSAHVEG
jgi:hypothetical protein